MHRHQFFRAQLKECLYCFFRIHVDLASTWRIICADRQERDLDIVALADFLEAREISAVATMENRATVRFDNEAAKTAMQISQETGSPMMARCQGNFQPIERHALPVIELMHDVETEVVNERADAQWHDDRLVGSNASQCSPIQMIKMRMCHQNEIDSRQVTQLDARPLQPFNYLQPFCPVRID